MNEALGGVALYNPHLLSEEEIVALFVVREPLLASILGDLPETDDGGAPQSQLVLGQRGMGKTMLLRRIACEIDRREDLKARWVALTFPEEQYDVASLGDFCRNCLDALGDALERRGQGEAAADLDRRASALSSTETDGGQAIQLLQETVEQLDRGLALFVDNVDLIFDRIGEDDQWTFRETLSESSRIVMVGASAHPMEATYQYGAAFYDFFRVRELKGLDLEETRALLRRLASRLNEAAVTEIVDSEPGRIQALHELTAGNPRTTVLLFQVLSQGIDGDVRGDLERLLDQCTPLYKARVEALAPQAQRILHGLALAWDPTTASDLAAQLGMDVNAVSSQLSRLVRDGVVEKVDYEPDARAAFQVAERLFAAWWLMRRGSDSRLPWLLEWIAGELADRPSRKRRRDPSGWSEVRDGAVPWGDREEPSIAGRLRAARDLSGLDWTQAIQAARPSLVRLAERTAGHDRRAIVTFFREAVAQGHAADAAALLDEVGLAERWRPLREALEAIVQGKRRYLLRVAPEVRKPAEALLDQMVGADWVGEAQATKRSRRKPRRRRRP